jgi:2-polyprenyl-6-methoxyphenol hydroxylase-like FAD-dependent oxidoreductase
MSDPLLIAGAGIGGLAAANACLRAGLAVRVLERATDLLPLGAGITVQANAMSALRSVGLDAAVATAGEVVKRSELRRWDGRILGEIPTGETERRLGAPVVGIHRGRLQQVLLGALPEGVVRTGAAVVGVEVRGEAVCVELVDGVEIAGGALIGADGLHSTVRRKLFGDTPPRYAGYTSWRGVTRRPAGVPSGYATELWGRGARFGYLGIGAGELYWFAVRNAPAGEVDPPEGVGAALRRTFAGWAEPIEEILATTAPNAILRTDIHDRPPIDRWGRGLVTLLGDAAHPMTPNLGQGGCQAIEDGVVLAHALRGAASIEEGLRAYERGRVARTRAIVERSRRFGTAAQQESRLACWVRDAAIRWTPRRIAEREFFALQSFSLPGFGEGLGERGASGPSS